ncbi:MAG TPA: MG2 domain-containing protein [Fimbriimonadaceae bacterium]|nr:MG2 domain-containing protein [Fimbriimonadaceae bacterium]
MNIRHAFVWFLLLLAAIAPCRDNKDVHIWISEDVAPSVKIRLQVNTTNVPVVHIAAYRVDGETWLRKLGSEERRRPSPLGRPVKEWNATIATPAQRANPNEADTYYGRQINLPPMSPGVYLLSVTGGAKEAWAVVNVTHLAVLAKRSPTKMLVWVTDAIRGQVLPGARVSLYTKEGNPIGSYRTGSDGTVMIPRKPGDETVVVGRGSDLAGVKTGAPDPDGRLVAHFQTDRPIYRPGQTVFFKTILRRTLGQGYRVVSNSSCIVEFRDPKDNTVDQVRLTSNSMGSVGGQFDIPSEGMLGAYSLVLRNGDDTAYQTLTVQEYRKPEFKVEVGPAGHHYLAGEELSFNVDAQYYFGAPVQQAAVHYQVRRAPMQFYDVGDSDDRLYGGDGNLYPRDTYSANPFVGEDTAYTDDKGHVVIKVPTDPKLPDSEYAITLTVEDSSRRQVQGGASAPVYAAAVRLAINANVQYAPLGSVIPFSVRAVDLDGKPKAVKVAIEMRQPVWNEKTGQWEEKHIASTSVKVPASGKASFNLPARDAGDFVIYATAPDGTGRTAKAQTGIWVWGNFEKPKKEKPEPTIDLKLDKRVYVPGETAKVIVGTNTRGRPILVVVEGGDVWAYHVILSPKLGQLYSVATDAQMSPNAYVTAAQWVKGQLLSANQILPLPDPSKQLTVVATPDKTDYRPGDTATYTIRTTSKSGQPVPAEVSLSVVDEAIYAIIPDVTPDLYRLYWGRRANQVSAYMSAPEEMSGGAYQRVSTVAPLRQRFEDTAYWNAFVETGPDGTGKISFEMPGNLTTWRATARGVTMATSVGMTTSKVVANRPVMLRLATPRQMVQGDQVTLIGTIDNRSDQEHRFDVSLASEGVAIDGQATRHITVPSKKQAKVEWILDSSKLPESGSASLTGQVVALDVPDSERADMSDALKVSVPIVPKGVKERVITGGIVARDAKATLVLPSDRLEPATVVKVQVSGGIGASMRAAASNVLDGGRWGSVGAANQLIVAAALKLPSSDKRVRESLALLSRNERPDGWGWWEQAPADPVITARVLWALGLARRSGITVYENLLRGAQYAATDQYNKTNLWEHRALLAASLMLTRAEKARDKIDEVIRRGKSLSPYSKLRMVEAMVMADSAQGASELAESALKDVSNGPDAAFLPTRAGIGWTAGNVETTAAALSAILALDVRKDLQPKFARWLVLPDNDYWRSSEEDATVAWTLSNYVLSHPDPTRIGEVEILVNGMSARSTPAKIGDIALATIPRNLLKSGENTLELKRTESGEAFFTVEASVYRPNLDETVHGVRVLRRFEVQNDAGIWVELNRKVQPGEPVRCTVIAWGDDVPDAMRIVEPIPAGFEFVDGEASAWSDQEVRDGAVIHYLVNQGAPQVFRYYIRAEAEGMLTALPAFAEYIRRPADRGQSNGERLEVRVAK